MMNVEQIGEGVLYAAVLQRLQVRHVLWQSGEVRFHVLVVGIDLAAFGVRHAQGLDRPDDDAATIPQVVRAYMDEVRDIKNSDPSVERVVQHLPIGMLGVLQGLDGLLPDGFCRHQPQDKGVILFDPGIPNQGYGVRGEDRLAAARG